MPAPDGGENGFYGEAALFTRAGEVVDSGAGSACPGCQWKWELACSPGDIGCSDDIPCSVANDGVQDGLRWWSSCTAATVTGSAEEACVWATRPIW